MYVVKKTETRWREYDESYLQKWENIDKIFIRRGYEQGGFDCGEFTNLLENHGIFSIEKIGSILDKYKGDIKYNRQFAGSLT